MAFPMKDSATGSAQLSGVTVYYPHDLLLFDGLSSDEVEPEMVQVSFRDGDGCQITLHIRRSALEALAARLRRRCAGF
jgi:hypothetical protein